MTPFLIIALATVLVAGILTISWTSKMETFCHFTKKVPQYVAKIQTNELPSTEDLMLTASNTQSAKYPSMPFWPGKCWKPVSCLSPEKKEHCFTSGDRYISSIIL